MRNPVSLFELSLQLRLTVVPLTMVPTRFDGEAGGMGAAGVVEASLELAPSVPLVAETT